jgi:hypothetical protein
MFTPRLPETTLVSHLAGQLTLLLNEFLKEHRKVQELEATATQQHQQSKRSLLA